MANNTFHQTPSMTVPGYEKLGLALQAAYDQSAKGKGKARHANNKPFDRQPILEQSRIVGIGFPAGQIMKKAGEAAQMAQRGEIEAAKNEFLGSIVYGAAAYILLCEMEDQLSMQSFTAASQALEIRQKLDKAIDKATGIADVEKIA